MDLRRVFWKVAARVVTSPAVYLPGAGAFLTSAFIENPLPVVLAGFWTLGYGYFSFVSGKYHNDLAREEAEAEQSRQVRQATFQRNALVQRLQTAQASYPFSDWVRGGSLPDLTERYRLLMEIRDRVVRLAHERAEVEDTLETDIQQQLDQLLAFYLKLSVDYFRCLEVLTGIRAQAEDPPAPTTSNDVVGYTSHGNTVRRSRGSSWEESPRRGFDSEGRIRELAAKRDDLKKRLADAAQKGTAPIFAERVKALDMRIQILRDCKEREERLAAQLDAFQDNFELIQDKVTATQISKSDITSFMGGVVNQVMETEQFVEALRPAMDAELRDLRFATLATER